MVFEAPAFVVGLDDVAMMGEAVEQGRVPVAREIPDELAQL
jgi:hypothetical protein